jgi:Tfp pilus assembly PilM family ATPase
MAKSKAVLGVEILGETARLVLAEVGEADLTVLQTRTVNGADALAKTIRTLGRRPSAVVCAVAMETAALRILSLPPTTDENLERVVALEAEGALPMGTEDLALAHHMLGMNEQSRLEVLLAAARQDVVQRALGRVNVAPYISSQATLAPIALVNALQQLRGTARENICAILKIENDYSELVVLDRTRVLTAQSIPGGTQAYVEQMVEAPQPVGVGAAMAEAGGAASGLGRAPSWVSGLAHQVRYALQAISYERGIAFERLYVCGAGATLAGVDWQLSEALDFPVTLLSASGDPEGAEFAVAYGCAAQAAGFGTIALNLTPMRVAMAREVEQRRQNTISWGALAGAAVVAAGLVFGAAVHQKQLELDALQAQLKELGNPLPQGVAVAPGDLKKISTQLDTALKVRVPPATLVAQLNSSLPQGCWLSELIYNADTGAIVRGGSTDPAGPQKAQIELLKAQMADAAAAEKTTGASRTRTAAAIQPPPEQPLFDEVTLNYVNEDLIGAKQVWMFEIACRLKPKEKTRGAVRR